MKSLISLLVGLGFSMMFPALPTRTANLPAAAPTTQATTFDQAMAHLASGDQAGAEHQLKASLQRSMKNGGKPDVEEVFLLAVITRSRFEIHDAAPLFDYVAKMAGNTPHGKRHGHTTGWGIRSPH